MRAFVSNGRFVYSAELTSGVRNLEQPLRASPHFAAMYSIMSTKTREFEAANEADESARAARVHVDGFPATDDDVEYLLEDASGLARATYVQLKKALLSRLDTVRSMANICWAEMETVLKEQSVCRPVGQVEVDHHRRFVIGRFFKARQEIINKYQNYLRNLKWLEVSVSRQRNGCLSKRQNNILRKWLFANFQNPYPDKNAKNQLASDTGLTLTQINNWFINARVRVWKPTVELMTGDRMRRESSAVGFGGDLDTASGDERSAGMSQKAFHAAHPSVVHGAASHDSKTDPNVGNGFGTGLASSSGAAQGRAPGDAVLAPPHGYGLAHTSSAGFEVGSSAASQPALAIAERAAQGERATSRQAAVHSFQSPSYFGGDSLPTPQTLARERQHVDMSAPSLIPPATERSLSGQMPTLRDPATTQLHDQRLDARNGGLEQRGRLDQTHANAIGGVGSSQTGTQKPSLPSPTVDHGLMRPHHTQSQLQQQSAHVQLGHAQAGSEPSGPWANGLATHNLQQSGSWQGVDFGAPDMQSH